MKHVILFAVAAALSLTACQKSAEEAEETAENTGAETTGLKIAYVEMAQKQRTLEQHAAAMQKKYESNGFTTRDELERAQNSIQAEQQQLQELADRLQTDFAQEQARVNQEARDSIQAFLRSYNKTKKYDYVLVKAGDNMLIANPKMDITKEVIKGLNKRYKKSRKTAD